jgi:hypothetical protein
MSTAASYLMGPIGRQGKFERHTAATRWISFEQAADLISQTTTKIGQQRDLTILRAAKEAFEKLPYADRPATCKEDWKNRPMPRRSAKISLEISYDDGAMRRIRNGFLPKEMEDKWFAWFDDPVLHVHRSWTGFCIYQITFVPDREGWRATFASVNRDQKQYTGTSDRMDRQEISTLIDHLLVHAD